MAKLLGMLYRDVNIALANELAAFCEAAGVDFGRVRAAANTDGEANLLFPVSVSAVTALRSTLISSP